MKTSPRARQFLKDHEGLRLKAYRDGGGVPTIGYGHTSDPAFPVKMGMTITKAQAEVMLQHDIMEAEQAIDRVVRVPLNGNQYGALVSLAFNIGNGALAKSTLVKMLNRKDYGGAAKQFGRWVNDNGKRVPGLVRRRAEEVALFNTPDALGTKVVKQPKVEATKETKEARETKHKVEPTKKRSSTDPTVIGGGLAVIMTILQPVLDLLSQLQYIAADNPTVLIVAVIAIAAIAFIIWKKHKENQEEAV